MSQLLFWTAAEPGLITKTFGASLKSFRPNVPPHQFVPFVEGKLIEPGEGDVVLCCGVKALDALRVAGVFPKNRSLDSLREKPVKLGAGLVMVTFDPDVIQSQPEKREILDWDVRLAHRLLTTGSLEPKIGDYRWVSSFAPLIAEIEEMYEKSGKPVKVSFDTETMGLYPWFPDKDFVCCSFTHKPGSAHMLYLGPQSAPIPLDPTQPLFDQIKWLLTSPKVRLRLANGKYDMIWVKEKWDIDCTNFKFDNLLVGSLLNENRSNSLNLHAKLFTDMGGYDDAFNDKFDKGHMEAVPTKELGMYQGGDTDACYQAADVLQAELAEDPQLTRFYVTVLHPAARAFEKIERRGILVDQEKYHKLSDELRQVVKESTAKQLSLLPGTMRAKYRDRIEDQIAQGKNPLLPSILNEFFFTPKGLNLKRIEFTPKDKKASLKKSHLRAVADGRPEAKAFIEAMTEGDVAAKTLSTFVEGFLRHLRPDGRLHPSYMLFHGGFADDEDDESGTVTGRLSAKEPAFQTTPKKTKWAKRIRECFPAPKGKVVVCIDYSQGELKVIACWAPEPTMIQAYLDGLDLHAVTGARLAVVPLQEFLKWKDNEDKALAALFDKHRGNAKPANFGLIYGMQVRGFMNYSWANYGIKLTFEEAEKMRNAFFQLYPGLLGYHERQESFVNLHQMVRSPLGRIRHLPTIKCHDNAVNSLAKRQAINSPIQSCLADMMEWAIALIDAEFPNEEIEVVGNIHDAIVAYIDEDKVSTLLPQAMQIMSSLPLHQLGWNPPLKFTVDAEAGPNLAAVKKFKVAA
jgi:DNA polymerase I-like protein with 3'-5' exonuclease and polymerase domains